MVQSGYTKLFGSILDSSIWRESKEVRLVWITMLAMADRDGIVNAAVPGLADRAKVTIEECLEALRTFSSPDQWSRTKESEGRRIEEVPGGWRLINHAEYRRKMSHEDQRDYWRRKKQEARQKEKEANAGLSAREIVSRKLDAEERSGI